LRKKEKRGRRRPA